MVAVKVNPKWPMMSRPSDYDFTPLQLACGINGFLPTRRGSPPFNPRLTLTNPLTQEPARWAENNPAASRIQRVYQMNEIESIDYDQIIKEIYEEIFALDTFEKQQIALHSWWQHLQDTCTEETPCIECARTRAQECQDEMDEAEWGV
jgi:hypothetical protein